MRVDHNSKVVPGSLQRWGLLPPCLELGLSNEPLGSLVGTSFPHLRLLSQALELLICKAETFVLF